MLKYLKVVKIYLKYILSKDNNTDIKKSQYIILDFPDYGNAGDNAIGLAMLDFIRNNISFNVTHYFVRDFYKNLKSYKKNIDSNTIIIMCGGGNMGRRYAFYEQIRETICLVFKNNKLVIFPQTFDFGNLKMIKNKLALNCARVIYSHCKDLVICAREKYSYTYMKKYFKKNVVLLIPDMALSYVYNQKIVRNDQNIIICIRDDGEKNLSENLLAYCCRQLKKKQYSFKEVSTYDASKNIWNEEDSRQFVNNTIQRISSGKMVITDRLHAMIFCYLTHTPCCVFENSNYKIRGVYEWIKTCGFIFLIHDEKDFDVAMNKIESKDVPDNKKYIDELLKKQFYRLESSIINMGK